MVQQQIKRALRSGERPVQGAALFLAVLRSVLAYGVLVAGLGVAAVGLPFALTLGLSLGAAACGLLPLSARAWALLLWACDAVVSAVTAFLCWYLADFAAPFGSPKYLPLYHNMLGAVAICAFSCAASVAAAAYHVFALGSAALHRNKTHPEPPPVEVEIVEVGDAAAATAADDDCNGSESTTSERKHRRRCLCCGGCVPQTMGELVVAAVCAFLGAVALAMTIASFVSLGQTIGAEPCPYGKDGCFEGCEPLGAGGCLLPFPSSFFLAPDTTTGTGLRVAFPQRAMPYSRAAGQIDPLRWNELDGFSVNAPALFDLPGAASLVLDAAGTRTTLPLLNNSLNTSLLHVAIVDATAGELVPCWAELDANGKASERPTVIVQPAQPLRYNRRYVVAVRGLVDNATGSLAPAAPGFAALMQAQSGDRWAWMRDQVLPAVHSVLGWADDELQLAWDFHTVSRRFALGRLERMRDDALIRDPTYKILRVGDYDCSAEGTLTGRSINGTITLPSYLVSNVRGSRLVARPGQEEDVEAQGTITADFIINIPCSVTTTEQAGVLVQYGHGFFNDRTEVNRKYVMETANENRWVIFAADWNGMAYYDEVALLRTLLKDPGNAVAFPEAIQQGHIIFTSLMHTVRTKIVSDPVMMSKNGTASLVDVRHPYFYGISQGGILGIANSALSTEVERVGATVPGGSFSILFMRSSLWGIFGTVIKLSLYNERDNLLFLQLLQSHLDPIEAGGWAYALTEEPIHGCKPKFVVVQSGWNDPFVSQYSAHYIVRALGAKTTEPATREVFGIPSAGLGNNITNSSGYTEYRYLQSPVAPTSNTAPESSPQNPHFAVPQEPSVRMQLRIFFAEGVIVHPCGERECVRNSTTEVTN